MSSESSAPSSRSAAESTSRPIGSVDLLQALLESSPDAVYFKDRESRFLLISRSLARLLGLAEPQEAYGKSDRDFFAPEHAEQARADEIRIMETGEPIIGLVEKETWPDGRVTWASSTKLPLRSAQGRIVGTFGISRDVTAHKAAEQRLQDVQRDLADTARRAPVPGGTLDTEALELVEHARLRTERLQRRAIRTNVDALSELSGRLAGQLTAAGTGQQLALELCAVASAVATDRRAFTEDLADLHRTLARLTALLAAAR